MLRLPASSLILPTVYTYDGALGPGRNHMPRTHRVKEALQHNPYDIFFIPLVSVFIFVFFLAE